MCREDKLILREVREATFIKKETSPTLNRDGGRELAKIYDSLLETPRSRTPSMASSRSESVSQHSATIRWGRRRVSLKYSDQKCECCWTVLKFLWCLLPTRIKTFIQEQDTFHYPMVDCSQSLLMTTASNGTISVLTDMLVIINTQWQT